MDTTGVSKRRVSRRQCLYIWRRVRFGGFSCSFLVLVCSRLPLCVSHIVLSAACNAARRAARALIICRGRAVAAQPPLSALKASSHPCRRGREDVTLSDAVASTKFLKWPEWRCVVKKQKVFMRQLEQCEDCSIWKASVPRLEVFALAGLWVVFIKGTTNLEKPVCPVWDKRSFIH